MQDTLEPQWIDNGTHVYDYQTWCAIQDAKRRKLMQDNRLRYYEVALIILGWVTLTALSVWCG